MDSPQRLCLGLLLTAAFACGGDSPTQPPDGQPPGGGPPGGPAGTLTPPDDPLFMERWYLFNLRQTIGGKIVGTAHADIRALEAWQISRGAGVIVAVLDAGVAAQHPSLKDRLVPGWDFVDDDPDPEDVRAKSVNDVTAKFFHGTAVADAVLSIAPEARIMPLRVIGQGIDDQDVADAVRFARDHGAKIVNMSFASFVPGFGYPLTAAAIAESSGILFVTGAGNEGNDADITRPEPCTIPAANVLCVAATDQDDRLASFVHSAGSNYGAHTVHMAAPGDNFLVAQPPIRTIHSDDFAASSPWAPAATGNGWSLASDAGFSGSTSLQYARGLGQAASRVSSFRGGRESAARMTVPVSFTGQQGCWLDFRYWSDLDGT